MIEVLLITGLFLLTFLTHPSRTHNKMKFTNIYRATILDETVERHDRGYHEIQYPANDLEDAFDQARYIGSRYVAEQDPECKFECKKIKIVGIELILGKVINQNECDRYN